MKHKPHHHMDDLNNGTMSKKKRISDMFEEEPMPGPSTSNGASTGRNFPPNFDYSDSDDEDNDYDRESLIKNIDADLRNIISRRDIDTKPERADFKGKALKKEKTEELGAGASNYRGKDGALYTFEIFMRDGASARSRRDRAGKADPRAPIVYNNAGLPNAIIPPNHKLMLLCTRLATHPSQYIKRGKYVLFKFYVDGEALSEGVLHEASISKPDIHFGKAYIDTHQVKDEQRVEFSHEANPDVGTFVVKVFTRLRETLVSEQHRSVPEDDRVLEKTKRRVCCSVGSDEINVTETDTNKTVKRFDSPQAGLAEAGLPSATIEISYDDLLGTRARHAADKNFSVQNLRIAGVTEEMLRAAYPTGVPDTSYQGTVDLVSDDEELEQDIKIEVKQEQE